MIFLSVLFSRNFLVKISSHICNYFLSPRVLSLRLSMWVVHTKGITPTNAAIGYWFLPKDDNTDRRPGWKCLGKGDMTVRKMVFRGLLENIWTSIFIVILHFVPVSENILAINFFVIYCFIGMFFLLAWALWFFVFVFEVIFCQQCFRYWPVILFPEKLLKNLKLTVVFYFLLFSFIPYPVQFYIDISVLVKFNFVFCFKWHFPMLIIRLQKILIRYQKH